MVTLVVGLPLGLVGWVVNEFAGVLSIQYLYANGVVFAFSCALMVGVSLFTRPTGPVRLHATVWSKALWQEDRQGLRGVPWYRNWLVLSALLLAVTAVVVVWWW
jgi:SSS family solute:Na+ symporter